MGLQDLDSILAEEEEPQRTFPTGAVAAVVGVALAVWGCIGLVGVFVAPVVASANNVTGFTTETYLQSAAFSIERYMIALEYGDLDRASDLYAGGLTSAERSRLDERADSPAYTQRVTDVTISAVEGIPVGDERLMSLEGTNPLYADAPVDFDGTLTYADGTERDFTFRMVRQGANASVATSWLIERATINE